MSSNRNTSGFRTRKLQLWTRCLSAPSQTPLCIDKERERKRESANEPIPARITSPRYPSGVHWSPGCLEGRAAVRPACEETRCGWWSRDAACADWGGAGSASISSTSSEARAAPGNVHAVEPQLGPHFQNQMWRSNWLTGSYLSVHEAVEHGHHETLRDVKRDKTVSGVLSFWVDWAFLSPSRVTCVDDRASSAKVLILNTVLLTSTGKKTNRM